MVASEEVVVVVVVEVDPEPEVKAEEVEEEEEVLEVLEDWVQEVEVEVLVGREQEVC